jgi:hypothetical protein
MVLSSALVVTLFVSVYVPLAGGINGGGAVTYSGMPPQTGIAACGPRYAFGTVFEIIEEDMSAYGLPQVVICADRGYAVGNRSLDLALVSPDVRGDLRRAREWGRRPTHVQVYESVDEYVLTHLSPPTWMKYNSADDAVHSQ